MVIGCRVIKSTPKLLLRRLLILVTTFPLVIFAASTAVAQTGQGSINGRVADPKGAGLPGATVVITNSDTKERISTKTDSTGAYNVPSLNPGNYSAAATAKGFEQEVIQDIVVSEASAVQMDMLLKIGSENIAITVTAQQSLLQMTSDVSTTVDHQLVESLPYPERSSLEAILLVPGVNGDPLQPGGIATENPGYTVSYVTPGASISVGGTPPGGTSILVDGSDVTQASYPRAGVNLSGPLVQESTVIVSGMSAKYGRSGSGIIIQGSRSGMDQYHGGITWRHTDPFFNAYPLGGTIPNAIHQNYYGFYLGGPVRISKVYNGVGKTFFYVGVEPARLSNAVGVRGTFQTPDDLAGHFNNSLALLNQTILSTQGYGAALAAPRVGGLYYQSSTGPNPIYPACASAPAGFPCGPAYGSSTQYQQISGPVTDCGTGYVGTTCPNDLAPQLAQNKFAQYVLSLYPTPSNPGPYVKFDAPDAGYQTDGTNGSYQRGVANIDNRYSFRIDQQFNNSNRLFVRYTVIPVNGQRFFGFAIDNPLSQVPTDAALTHDIALGFTHVFTDNLVSNFRYSFLRVNQQRLPPTSTLGLDTAAKYGLTPAIGGKGFPSLGLNAGASGGVNYSLASGSASASAAINVDQNFIVGADFTWTHGAHLFQFGVDLRWIQSNQYDLSGLYGGKYSFASNQTNNGSAGGDSMATFILGDISTFSNTPLSVPGYYRWRYYAGYFQDDWRATPRLTVNVGLRYDLETPRMEKFNNQGVVEPFAGTLNGQPINSAFCFSGSCGFPKGLWPINPYGFEPRIGISYAATSRSTIRASYALSRMPLTGYENTPDPDFNVASASIGTTAGGTTPGYLVNYITNPVASLSSAYTQLIAQWGRGPVPHSTGLIPEFVNQTNAVPYMQSYSLTLQYQPASKTVVQATYQGVKGTHLIGAFNNPLNTASISQILSAVQQGTYLGGSGTPNIYGITNPGTTSLILENNLQRLYPYQNFFNQSFNEIYPRRGTLEYNGLYLSVNQRMTKDLTFLSYYQWSKSLDDVPDTNSGTAGGFGTAPQQNPLNMAAEYSVSSFDQPSRFRAGYSYNLPFGIGERFQTHHALIDRLIGNFATSGIMSIASGFPNYVMLGSVGYFTIPTPAGVGGCTASGTAKFCTTQALPSGYTIRPNIVPGVPLINPSWKKNPFNSVAGITPYLNPAAFSVPGTIGNPQLGNAPRTLSNARSPREFTFDAHVGKGFTLHGLYKISLTCDFSNAFNHPVYYGVGGHTLLSSTSVSAVSGLATNTAAAGFGDLSAGNSGGMSRVIRFGGQLTF